MNRETKIVIKKYYPTETAVRLWKRNNQVMIYNRCSGYNSRAASFMTEASSVICYVHALDELIWEQLEFFLLQDTAVIGLKRAWSHLIYLEEWYLGWV